MFQTNLLEKIKTHILCSVTVFFFFGKSCRLWDNVEKYFRVGQTTEENIAPAHCILDTQWRTEGGWGFNPPPPRNSEALTKLSRIPSSVENTSVTTLDIPKVWQSRTGLQIERNQWLGTTAPQIPVLYALCPQLNLWNPPPGQNSWVRHWLEEPQNRSRRWGPDKYLLLMIS
jgi:hypothetical protein